MKTLVLDNYDSFTYNLVYILRQLGVDSLDVFRNDKIDLAAVAAYDLILLSPGPGLPKDAGIMQEIIKAYAPSKRILGICLGHQGIGEAFGASLFNLPVVKHGLSEEVHLVDKENKLFDGLPLKFPIGLYYSWAIQPESIKGDIHITALDQDGNVMGIKHNDYDVQGLQFHPESIMTHYGVEIMRNWIS